MLPSGANHRRTVSRAGPFAGRIDHAAVQLFESRRTFVAGLPQLRYCLGIAGLWQGTMHQAGFILRVLRIFRLGELLYAATLDNILEEDRLWPARARVVLSI